MHFDPQIALIAAVVFLIAGVIKGTVGIGLPTVSVGILSQVLPPQTAIALVVFPILLSNLLQVIRAGKIVESLRRYALLLILLATSLWATTGLTSMASPEFLMGAIGTAIVIFAASSLIGTPHALPDRLDRVGQVTAGLASGILGGLTSIWSPPFVTYLLARRVDADEFVRASGLIILIGGVPLAIGFWLAGLLNGETAPLSALMIIPTLAGFFIGEIARRHLSPEGFRKVLLWIFLLMGLNLLRRALF